MATTVPARGPPWVHLRTTCKGKKVLSGLPVSEALHGSCLTVYEQLPAMALVLSAGRLSAAWPAPPGLRQRL
jgi:hypothetical protein